VCNDQEQASQAANLEAVVNRGRMPGLMLQRGSGEQPMAEYATELFSALRPVAELLDRAHESSQYTQSLQQQLAKVADPDLTPSARVLREMQEKDLPFFRLAMAYSEQWADHFRKRELSAQMQAEFEQESKRSIAAQREVEQADTLSFKEYLENYFAQYRAL